MKLVFLAILICACSTVSAVNEVEDAGKHNMGIASSLLGAGNACNSTKSVPSERDIFLVADIRAAAIVPSIGNVTSDLAQPKLVWSWSSSAPAQASFPVESQECPDGKIEYTLLGKPRLESATLKYSYGNAREEILLGENGPNPIPLDLGNGSLSEADYAELYVPLELEFYGVVAADYSFRKSSYERHCQSFPGGIVGCGCEMKFEAGERRFEKKAGSSRNFSVETGENYELWLSPPLAARLEGKQGEKLAIFARRMPAKISLYSEGQEIGRIEPYAFEIAAGECGEKVALRKLLPREEGVSLNASELPVSPAQLVGMNASYAQFLLKFDWGAEAGKKKFTIISEDAFGGNTSFARNFSVRAPSSFSADSNENAGALAIRQGSEREMPAAYPPRAPLAREIPDIAALAALFALPFALGSYSFLRRAQG